jgi:histidinol-phosphatase (PHP family)
MRAALRISGVHDYHVHSNYSDGRFLPMMVDAAVDAGLDGVGFADHCNVSAREEMTRYRDAFAFNLDLTYERRRSAIETLRERYDLHIFDAVEMDYHPDDETRIREFLDDAGFDYAIGSVHEIDGANVHWDYFADLDAAGQRAAVDEYVDHVVALAESGLFDVAAHVDIVERNPALRGYAGEDDYHRIAAALEQAGMATEINAGRVHADYGRFHPRDEFYDVLAEYDVPVVLGSDSHRPDEIGERLPTLREQFDEVGRAPATLNL